MKQSVTAFLSQQDRDKFKDEHKVYQIDKDLAKKEETIALLGHVMCVLVYL